MWTRTELLLGAVWSTLFDQEAFNFFQQAKRADDFCCDWRFGGKTMLINTNIYTEHVHRENTCHLSMTKPIC